MSMRSELRSRRPADRAAHRSVDHARTAGRDGPHGSPGPRCAAGHRRRHHPGLRGMGTPMSVQHQAQSHRDCRSSWSMRPPGMTPSLMVREVAATEKRIELLARGSRGVGAARNAGAARAKGRYLIFVDAGDVLPRGAFRAGDVAAPFGHRPRAGPSAQVRRRSSSATPTGHRRCTCTTAGPSPWTTSRTSCATSCSATGCSARCSGGARGSTFPPDVPQSSATLASAYVDARRIDVLRASPCTGLRPRVTGCSAARSSTRAKPRRSPRTSRPPAANR